MLLDTTHEIATPEGVDLRLPLAGLAPRSLAWLIDTAIKTFAIVIGSVILAFVGDLGTGLLLIALFVSLWFYNVLFEVLNHGMTPGKKALGLRVMNVNGTPVGWSGSMIRNLLRFVDTLPGTYAFGCTAVLLSRRFQRLGDMAAGTVVVYREKPAKGNPFTDIEPLAVKVPLSVEEQQAIVSFGERALRMNQDRTEELAALLDPVFRNIDATRLRQHAAWLAGGGRSE